MSVRCAGSNQPRTISVTPRLASHLVLASGEQPSCLPAARSTGGARGHAAGGRLPPTRLSPGSSWKGARGWGWGWPRGPGTLRRPKGRAASHQPAAPRAGDPGSEARAAVAPPRSISGSHARLHAMHRRPGSPAACTKASSCSGTTVTVPRPWQEPHEPLGEEGKSTLKA